MNRCKLERPRIHCLSLYLLAWFSFIWHCRHPKSLQNNHIQAANSEQSVDYAKVQIGVKYFCGECWLGQFNFVMVRKHARDGTKCTVCACA